MSMGSGYPADPITIRFLRRWIKKYNKFPSDVRSSWKTIKKLENGKKTKSLDDF